MLLTLESSLVERLILLFDALDFALDFPRPLVLLLGETLVGTFLKSSYFIYFGFLFNFKKGLLYGLSKKYIQDGLDFSIVVKKVIVFNLSDFVDSSFLRDIRGSRRSR